MKSGERDSGFRIPDSGLRIVPIENPKSKTQNGPMNQWPDELMNPMDQSPITNRKSQMIRWTDGLIPYLLVLAHDVIIGFKKGPH